VLARGRGRPPHGRCRREGRGRLRRRGAAERRHRRLGREVGMMVGGSPREGGNVGKDEKAPGGGLRMRMRVVERAKRVAVLEVEGFVDTSTAPEFEKMLRGILDQAFVNLVINVAKTSYVSSLGWGVLLSVLDEVRDKKGVVRLACLSPEVQDIYKIMGFSHLIRVYGTEEEAIESCPN